VGNAEPGKKKRMHMIIHQLKATVLFRKIFHFNIPQ
jgi:hypothetical protein